MAMNALKTFTPEQTTAPDGGSSPFALARMAAANDSGLELVSANPYRCPPNEQMLAPRSVYRDATTVFEIYDDRVETYPVTDLVGAVGPFYIGRDLSGTDQMWMVAAQQWRAQYVELADGLRKGSVWFDPATGELMTNAHGFDEVLRLDDNLLPAIQKHCEGEIEGMCHDLGMNLARARSEFFTNNALGLYLSHPARSPCEVEEVVSED